MNGSLLKVEHVCQELNMSRSMIYGLFRSGDLPSIKIGGSRRVSRKALDDYLLRVEAVDSGSLAQVAACG